MTEYLGTDVVPGVSAQQRVLRLSSNRSLAYQIPLEDLLKPEECHARSHRSSSLRPTLSISNLLVLKPETWHSDNNWPKTSVPTSPDPPSIPKEMPPADMGRGNQVFSQRICPWQHM